MSIKLLLLFVIAISFFINTPSPAQQQVKAEHEVRIIKALNVEKAPQIDGIINDPCWIKAAWQENFTQLKPYQGEVAQVVTRVAIAFDSDHLYAAFHCFNLPGKISNSSITHRDGNMDYDNAVTLYLDTFHNRRDCYFFSTNSIGTQVDGRIGENGGSNDKSWDCSWRVKSREDSSGWTTEMAVPFSEIRIPREKEQVWGLNFRRNYPELLETSFWNKSDRVWQVSRFGDLAGLHSLNKSFGISFFPYLVNFNSNTNRTERRHIYSSGETEIISGGDMRFNIGAKATGNITYNPDFATVEADQEVINLTRYETFFPEKRLYFLEGAELFQNEINVFYSRRIGDLDYGIKSSGRLGKSNFAVLSATERSGKNTAGARTSVFRLQRDLFGSSNIGFLTVDRSFNDEYNRIISSDATIFLPSHFRITSQFAGSIPSDGKFTKAYFLNVARDEERYHYNINYTNVDPKFKEHVNQVGFIPDDNRREVNGNFHYFWWLKNSIVERINFSSINNVFWSHQGTLRNAGLGQSAGVTFKNKWFAAIANNYNSELFEKRFYNHTISPGVGYNLDQWYSYQLRYNHGRNFGSGLRMWTFQCRIKPLNNLSLEYRFRHARFIPDPSNRNTVQNILVTDYNFTRDFYLQLFTQSNSHNNRFYLYGLLGWRFMPPFGALYLAYTADYFDDNNTLLLITKEKNRTLFIKLTVPITI